MYVSRETNKIKELIIRGFEELSLGVEERHVETLASYVYLISKYNNKVRLCGYKKTDDITNNLVLDSLLFFKAGINLAGKKVLDVGAGAGIPSLPLKICFDSWCLYLLESSGRKAAFLRKVLLELNIKQAWVLQERLETLNKLKEFSCDLVLSRAVGNLPGLLRSLKPITTQEAIVVLYQGEVTARKTKEFLEKNPSAGYRLYDQKIHSFSFLSHPRILTILKKN